MKPFLPILLLSGTVLAFAQEEAEVPQRKIPAVSLLPDGSVMESVMLPRYDERRKLVDVLRAKTITLVDAGRISGEAVSIEFFAPDRSRRGRIDLGRALYDQEKGTLIAEDDVRIDSERLIATGSGLVYEIENGEGFLIGPATTRIITPIETAMNHRPSPLRASALLGISLLSLPVMAESPPGMSPDETAALESDAASRSGAAREAAAEISRNLEAAAASGAKAKADAIRFLNKSGFTLIADEAAKPDHPAGEPLAVEPDPANTLIKCEDGMYFDAGDGVLVFMGNVTVTDPRFNLSGANELKVFMEKKPENAATDKPEEDDEGGMNLGRLGEGFGDVSRIVATGAVRILQKGVGDDEPIEASGAILVYNVKAGEIIISGGYPWVMQGPKKYFRATRPNERLRIFTAGNFQTEGGHWEMGVPLNEKR